MRPWHCRSVLQMIGIVLLLLGFPGTAVWGGNALMFTTMPTPDSSIPDTITVGQPYTYDADAKAGDGSAVQYSLQYGPAGMMINSVTGVVSWLPGAVGDYSASIRAELVNDPGQSVIQEWKIVVSRPSGAILAVHAPPAGAYCPGRAISVQYEVTGTFNARNVFILQLSDINGSFQQGFINLGAVTSRISGTIPGKIPDNIVPGNRYRVRVVASNPILAGPDNGHDLLIGERPRAAFQFADRPIDGDSVHRFDQMQGRELLQHGSLEFSNYSEHGAAYHWDFGEGASPATSSLYNPGVITWATGGLKSIYLSVTSPGGCVSTARAIIHVIATTIDIKDRINIVRSDTILAADNLLYWVCPGGVLRTRPGGGETIYVEPGGSVFIEKPGVDCLVYLKSGAALIYKNAGGGYHRVIYEPGAILLGDLDSGIDFLELIAVESVTFDYTEARSEGCPSLVPYTKRIPGTAVQVSGDEVSADSSREFWVRAGGVLKAGGCGNIYTVDPGGAVIAAGDSCTIYLKDGGTFEARGSRGHRVYYEVHATILNFGGDPILLPSSMITLVYEGDLANAIWERSALPSNEALVLAPNPASSTVMLYNTGNAYTIRRIAIHDIAGGIVYQKDIRIHTGECEAISLEGLAPGAYYLHAYGDGAMLVKKMLVR